MLFEFLANHSSEVLTFFLSLFAAIMPIPMVINELLGKVNQRDKVKIDIKDEEKGFLELKIDQNELENILYSSMNSNGDGKQDNPKTTPPSPQPHDFLVPFSSQKNTLNELYEKRNTDKLLKKISFTLAVVMSIIGTIILFVGILISLFTEKEIGWITTSSGAIIELVAGIYFWLVNRTMKEVSDNSKQLEKKEDLLTAIELANKINDANIKDEAYKNMIDKLLPQNGE